MDSSLHGGNGRVGRLLTDAALKAVGLDSCGAWCLSRGLAKSATHYISTLLNLPRLRQRIDSYVQARNDFRVQGVTEPLKSSAALILYTAFIHGEIDRAHALELCAMPERTARRLLSQLKSEGLLSETSFKSPLRWEIPEHAEPWYFPDLTPIA